jgi:hypothetical protein
MTGGLIGTGVVVVACAADQADYKRHGSFVMPPPVRRHFIMRDGACKEAFICSVSAGPSGCITLIVCRENICKKMKGGI